MGPTTSSRRAVQGLQNQICVAYPYNKLENVRAIDESTVEAHFNAEQVVHGDVGHGPEGVSTAEVARHCAIAGSLAAALKQPSSGRKSYLAIRAKFEGSKLLQGRQQAGSVDAYADSKVKARCTSIKRSLAKAEIESHGCRLSVTFAVTNYDDMLQGLSGVEDPFPTSQGTYLPDLRYFPYGDSAAHPDHYVSTPSLEQQSIEESRNVQYLWKNAQFPGHFGATQDTQAYAIAAVSAVMAESIATLCSSPMYNLQTEVTCRRLVNASTPCIVNTRRLEEVPEKFARAGAEHPQAQVFHFTLIEQSSVGDCSMKPAIEMVALVTV